MQAALQTLVVASVTRMPFCVSRLFRKFSSFVSWVVLLVHPRSFGATRGDGNEARKTDPVHLQGNGSVVRLAMLIWPVSLSSKSDPQFSVVLSAACFSLAPLHVED